MDVKNAKNFKQNSLNYLVPPYCCKEVEFDFPNVKAPANDSNYDCARNPTKENSNYMTVIINYFRGKIVYMNK